MSTGIYTQSNRCHHVGMLLINILVCYSSLNFYTPSAKAQTTVEATPTHDIEELKNYIDESIRDSEALLTTLLFLNPNQYPQKVVEHAQHLYKSSIEVNDYIRKERSKTRNQLKQKDFVKVARISVLLAHTIVIDLCINNSDSELTQRIQNTVDQIKVQISSALRGRSDNIYNNIIDTVREPVIRLMLIASIKAELNSNLKLKAELDGIITDLLTSTRGGNVSIYERRIAQDTELLKSAKVLMLAKLALKTVELQLPQPTLDLVKLTTTLGRNRVQGHLTDVLFSMRKIPEDLEDQHYKQLDKLFNEILKPTRSFQSQIERIASPSSSCRERLLLTSNYFE